MPVPGAVSKFLQSNHLLRNWEATSPNIYRWKKNGSRDRTEGAAVFRGTGKEEKVTERPRRLRGSINEDQLEWGGAETGEASRRGWATVPGGAGG